jgi:hypothetical protein
VWLRAGWDIGSVLKSYIRVENGGDQSVGRAATGLNTSTFDIAVLPVRFHPDFVDKIDFSAAVVNYDSFPEQDKVAMRLFLAAVVFHSEYLLMTLHPTSPVFLSRFWRGGFFREWKPFVLGPSYFHCPLTGMRATGIPTFVAFAGLVKDRIDAVEEKVDGTNKPTSEELKLLIKEAVSESVRNSMRDIQTAEYVSLPLAASNSILPETGVDRFFMWDGDYFPIKHPVPLSFVWPSGEGITLRIIHDLWTLGDNNAGIRPYKLIKGVDLPKPKVLKDQTRQWKNFSICRSLMSYFDSFFPPNYTDQSASARDLLFRTAYKSLEKELLEKFPTRSTNYATQAYNSLYTHYVSQISDTVHRRTPQKKV